MIEYIIGCVTGGLAITLIRYIFPCEGCQKAENLRQEVARKEMVIQQLLARDGLGTYKQTQWGDGVITMQNGDVAPKENK